MPNTQTAIGTFVVNLISQGEGNKAAGSTLGRLSLDKQFHNDLVGSSEGEMLSAVTETKGSAGYVAIERVTGSLHGRTGSFVLLHSGLTNRGAQQLSIVVVPDSGTGELTGLTGKMAIRIANGQHLYEFEYSLPEE
jgi:hypothetical protein